MLRVVLDTNILVSALRSRSGKSFQLLNHLVNPIWRPCISVPVALEYEDVLKREGMQPWIDQSDVDELLNYYFSVSDRIHVPFRLRPTLRDPDDERILELAAHAGATIITFNTKDFVGAEAYKVSVMQPVDFLRLIGESE